MEAIQGAIGLSPSNVVPRGLGTAELESFSGYAARISAKVFVYRVIPQQTRADMGCGLSKSRTPTVL